MNHLSKLALAGGVALIASQSFAFSTLNGQYFALRNNAGTRHIDVQKGIDAGIVTGLVEDTLGANGLPVVSAFGKTYAGPSGAISDYDNVTGELQWWSVGTRAANKETLADGPAFGGVTIPLNTGNSFFAYGAANNSQYFRTARWSGVFNVNPGNIGSINMSIQADDDAWVFVNGKLVLDAGGIKAINVASPVFNTAPLQLGLNTIDIFFADRHTVQSELRFDSNVEIVPEPASMAALGLGALALLRRRRSK